MVFRQWKCVFSSNLITFRISSLSSQWFLFHFDFLLFFSIEVYLSFVFSVFSCPPIVFPSSLSFNFRSSAWPVLYFSLIVKQLCWQQMFGALQLGENEPTPIFRDPLVFTQHCLTVLTALPSVPQVWDSRTLSSPRTCHRATGGYRLGEKSVIRTIGWSWVQRRWHVAIPSPTLVYSLVE